VISTLALPDWCSLVERVALAVVAVAPQLAIPLSASPFCAKLLLGALDIELDELLNLGLEDDKLLAGALLEACELLLLSEDAWLLVAAELNTELLAMLLDEIAEELTDDLATELITEIVELLALRLDVDKLLDARILLFATLLDARELMAELILAEDVALLMALELGVELPAELFTELLTALLLEALALRELAIAEPIRLELSCDVLVELAANELAAVLLLLNELRLTLA
jgi:hypothetical protein